MAPRSPTEPDRTPPRSRVEQEIEEILEREESKVIPLHRSPPLARITRVRVRGPAFERRFRITPGSLMLVALGLVIAGLFRRSLLGPLAFAAIVTFGVGYAWAFTGSGRQAGAPILRRTDEGGGDVYWRGERVRGIDRRQTPGKVLEFRPSLGSRIRRWFRRG